MKNIRWTARARGRIVGSGVLEAEDERSAVVKLLAEPPFPVDPAECYALEVGGTMASAYGDEFDVTAEGAASGSDDVAHESPTTGQGVDLSFVEEEVLGVADGQGVGLPIIANSDRGKAIVDALFAGAYVAALDQYWRDQLAREQARAEAEERASVLGVTLDQFRRELDWLDLQREPGDVYVLPDMTRITHEHDTYGYVASAPATAGLRATIGGVECPIEVKASGDLVVDLEPAARAMSGFQVFEILDGGERVYSGPVHLGGQISSIAVQVDKDRPT